MVVNHNIDFGAVARFRDEWCRFDQSNLPEDVGFDSECGCGRSAMIVAPNVGKLHCIGPSAALRVVRRNLENRSNCAFISADADPIPLAGRSMDFGYSLGVLHHIADTTKAMAQRLRKLKADAPFFVGLYYSFGNRSAWFRALWWTSKLIRNIVSRSPFGLRFIFSQLFAFVVYLPLARGAVLAERRGVNVSNFPLSNYRNGSFYTMRADALDRFGTRLEQRFSKAEIMIMTRAAAPRRTQFSNNGEPFWRAVGYRDIITVSNS